MLILPQTVETGSTTVKVNMGDEMVVGILKPRLHRRSYE
jgi:hypothetical protein